MRVIEGNCCGKFQASDEVSLSAGGYAERFALFGFCPRCNNFVIEIYKKNFKGQWFCEAAKRKKAVKLYESIKNDIVNNLVPGEVKQGTKAKMNCIYGENKMSKKQDKVLHFAVDFNGVKKYVDCSPPFIYKIDN